MKIFCFLAFIIMSFSIFSQEVDYSIFNTSEYPNIFISQKFGSIDSKGIIRNYITINLPQKMLDKIPYDSIFFKSSQNNIYEKLNSEFFIIKKDNFLIQINDVTLNGQLKKISKNSEYINVSMFNLAKNTFVNPEILFLESSDKLKPSIANLFLEKDDNTLENISYYDTRVLKKVNNFVIDMKDMNGINYSIQRNIYKFRVSINNQIVKEYIFDELYKKRDFLALKNNISIIDIHYKKNNSLFILKDITIPKGIFTMSVEAWDCMGNYELRNFVLYGLYSDE